MFHETIDGVVVRVRDYGDHDRYLSLLTAERGRIMLLSKGHRSFKSEQKPISQLYAYGNYEYYRRGDFNILKGGQAYNLFYKLSSDIDRLDLAAYLCDLTCEVTDEGEPAPQMLRLLLNSLHVIGEGTYPQEIVKGAFELRTAVLSGYEPELSGCAECGCEEADFFYLNVMSGALICPECMKKQGKTSKVGDDTYDDLREAEVICPISPSVLAAIRYCVGAPLKRIFSFELKDEEELRVFSKTAETYILSHLGRGFDSLRFYHEMRQPQT